MCGRYFQARSSGDIARYFGTTNATPNLLPSFNKAPTQEGLVVRRHPQTGARHLDVLRWGLVPRWAKDATGAARMMNARGESVAEKPAFRDAFHKRRCLVPMDGFYEWRAEGKGKQPFACSLRSGEPMACAGLWDEAWDAWLAGEEEAALLALLRPAEDALLAFWPVAGRVGRVAENDAGLIARDPLAVAPPELDDAPPAPGG